MHTFRLDSLPLREEVLSIQIDNGRRSRRLQRIVSSDLVLPVSQTTEGGVTELWSNGSLTMGALDLEDLYTSDLYLNVATTNNEKALRGRLVLQSLSM